MKIVDKHIRVSFVTLLLLVPLLAGNLEVRADENLKDVPHPASAHNLPTGFDTGDAPVFLDALGSDDLEKALSSSSLKLNLRNYYFDQINSDGTQPLGWAQGNVIEHQIGKVNGIFSMSTEFATSYPLHAPSDKEGSKLLEPDQGDIETFQVVNPRFHFGDHVVSLYRQRFDLPFLNVYDVRMLPLTQEGYTLSMGKDRNEVWQYNVGYINSIKEFDSEHFVSMSDSAGVTEKENGLYLATLTYAPIEELTIGTANYYTEDVYNTFYFETAFKNKLSENFANAFSVQYADQRSVGEDLVLDGTSYATGLWGIQEALSYRNATLKVAFNQIESDADVKFPFGSFPGYTGSMVEHFNRAGESSYLLGAAYDFSRLGLEGLALNVSYVSGDSAIDEVSRVALPDRNETDITLDYHILNGLFEGLWFRARAASLHEEGVGTTQNYRLILNYDFSLFSPVA